MGHGFSAAASRLYVHGKLATDMNFGNGEIHVTIAVRRLRAKNELCSSAARRSRLNLHSSRGAIGNEFGRMSIVSRYCRPFRGLQASKQASNIAVRQGTRHACEQSRV